MKTRIISGLIFTGLMLAGGCTPTSNLEVSTDAGNKMVMDLTGSGEQLLKQKRIDFAGNFVMPDKTSISAWAINTKTSPAKGTVVLLHGLGESKANYLGLAQALAKDGYDAVLIDLRRHGYSTGKYITCGAKEKQDVKSVIDKLIADKKITAKPLYVFGVNFGAVTGIMYAAIEPNVEGIVAIAPWKDTRAKFKRDHGLLTSPEQLDKIIIEAGQAADFDPDKTSASEDVKKLKCPIMLIHGVADLMVPTADSEAIFASANEPKKLLIFILGSPEHLALGFDFNGQITKNINFVAGGMKEKSAAPKKAAPAPVKKEEKSPATAPAKKEEAKPAAK